MLGYICKNAKWIKLTGAAAMAALLVISAAALFSASAADDSSGVEAVSHVSTSDEVSGSDAAHKVSLYEFFDHEADLTVNCEPKGPVQIEKYVPKADDPSNIFSVSAAYDGSYRSELGVDTQFIYDEFYDAFAVQKKNAIVYLDLSGKQSFILPWPDVDDDISDEDADTLIYQMRDELMDIVGGAVTSAGCAFIYDNPQIFWIGNIVPISVVFNDSEDGLGVSLVQTYPVDYYDEAYSQMSEFDAGVTAAVAEINASLPQNASVYQKIKAVHDYICSNASYDYAAVRAPYFDLYWYTQTAAPLFVDAPDVFVSGNKYFVCAGYAKSFKVLCDRMGLNACTLVGWSYGGGHAWNYIQAENGIWYAMDTTWDDGTTSFSYNYFMLGGKRFISSHTADPYLTNSSEKAFRFDLPRLSYIDYKPNGACMHTCTLNCDNEVEATCYSNGFSGDWYCSNCGELIYKGETIDTLPHEFRYEYNDDATCVHNATKTEVCTVCGKSGRSFEIPGTKLPHDFSSCEYLDDEYHAEICSGCGITNSEKHTGGTPSYDTPAVCGECGHTYGNYLELDVKLNMSAITLAVGDSFIPDVYRYPSDCGGTVEWSSSNEAVARVDGYGRITAVAKGKADITAKLYYCTAVIKVSVVPVSKVPATQITINKSEVILERKCSKLNPTVSLSAKITGSGTGKTWYSDNINVATVTSGGKVTAVGEGTANIYCRTADGTVSSAPCAIKVLPCRIESSHMYDNIIYVNEGESCLLSMNSAIGHGTVTWKSSNAKTAAINETGRVTGIKKGTVTITATMADKTKDTVKLVVVAADSAMTLKASAASVYVGKTVSLKTVIGTRGSNEPVFWSSSNTAVATVTNKGVVKGIRQGKVTITAKTYNGVTMTAIVTVRTRATAIEFTRITPAEYYSSYENAVFTVKLTAPYNCNDTVTWTSSNRRVACITGTSADGKTLYIMTTYPGTTTITAKTGSGKKVSCKFTCVASAATDVQLNMYSADIYVGKTVTLKAKSMLPKGCNDVVLWRSLDPSIATVDENGKVTGKAPGTVVINADTFGGARNSVTVTVRGRATSIAVDKTAVSLNINDSDTIHVTSMLPLNCNDKITWTTSSKSIATVTPSADGRSAAVIGLKKGTATITVKTGSGKYSRVKVTVMP